MEAYILVFSDDGTNGANELAFEAEDGAHAVMFAYRESADRSSELWKNGQKLCGIDRVRRQEMTMPPRQSWNDGSVPRHFQH